MAIFITAYHNRTTRELITFLGRDADGNVITPTLNAGSQVRMKFGKAGQTPLVDLSSEEPLTDGTSVTAENPATLEIVGSDFAAMKPGVYDVEAIVVDSADSDRAKLADEGTFVLIGTQGGAVN